MTETGNRDAAVEQFEVSFPDRGPDDWSALLARDPAAEYSQTRHWIETVCAHLPDASPLWMTVRRQGELVAGLAAVGQTISHGVAGLRFGHRRYDSSHEGTSGGPVLSADLNEDEQDLIFGLLVDALADRRKGLLASCTMALSPERESRFGAAMARRPAWSREEVSTAMISLNGGIDKVDSDRLGLNKRNERNRALRRGVEVTTTTNKALLEEYYRIYERAADHWGIEPVPLPLLQALLDDPDGHVYFICIGLEGKVIGGHLNLHFGRKALAWNGVTDPVYARRYFPATACVWGDLQEACRRSASWLDLGGSGSVNTLSGFKKYFGAELKVRGFYVNDSAAVRLLGAGRRWWRERRSDSTGGRWHDSAKTRTDGNGS